MSFAPKRLTSQASALVAALSVGGLVLVATVGCASNLENLEPTATLECGRLAAPNEEETVCQPLIAPNVQSKDVEFVSGQATLKGTLTLPEWGAAPNLGKRAPVIVLVGAEGPVSRDGLVAEETVGPYRAPVALMHDLAQGLSRRGYAVLRYDKRTCTPDLNPLCTSPPEIASAAQWSDFVQDAVAAAKFVKTLPEVDGGDIILLGFSQGATVALEASEQIDGLTELVLLAGVFDPIDAVMVRRIKWKLEAFEGSATKEELEAMKKQRSILESGFMAIKEGYMPPEEVFYGASPTFWKDWIAATTMTGQNLQRLNRPVFYMRGATDQDASKADQAGFAEGLAGKANHKVMELSGHNHAFVVAGEDGKVSDESIRVVSEWLGRPPTGRKPTIESLD